ncbi:MAG: hypothetical protein WCO26_05290, partial [Deltaproteobacteria bacterium]
MILKRKRVGKNSNRRRQLSQPAPFIIDQSTIVWTLKTKSLLSSLYKREEFPLFVKEGLGEIFERICLL